MKVYLIEALTPKQKAKVDNWEHGDTSFSDHAFESPAHKRTYIELGSNQKGQHEDEITAHLAQHGYTMHSYKDGIAKDKYGRLVKIGKALGKTKGEHLLDKFTGDPVRQQKSASNDDHQVVISRHPHDVAGMTSSGHSWINSSCMNFATGQNKHYLPEDVKHGTHVAYLIHKNDTEIKKPLARIALKPFQDIESGQKILHPESATYGNAPDSFQSTVNSWAAKHFPVDPSKIYKKNPDVYHDTGSRVIASRGSLGAAARMDDHRIIHSILAQHNDWTHKELAPLLDRHMDSVAAKVTNLPHETINTIIDHVARNPQGEHSADMLGSVAAHSDFTPETHKKAWDAHKQLPDGYKKSNIRNTLLIDKVADPADVHAALTSLKDQKLKGWADRRHLLTHAYHAAHPAIFEPIIKDFLKVHDPDPTIAGSYKQDIATKEIPDLAENRNLRPEHSHVIINHMLDSVGRHTNKFGGVTENIVLKNLIEHPGIRAEDTGNKVSTEDLHRIADHFIKNMPIEDRYHGKLLRHPNADAALNEKLYNHFSASAAKDVGYSDYTVARELKGRALKNMYTSGWIKQHHIDDAVDYYQKGDASALSDLVDASSHLKKPLLPIEKIRELAKSRHPDSTYADAVMRHLSHHPLNLEDQPAFFAEIHPSRRESFIRHHGKLHPDVKNAIHSFGDDSLKHSYMSHDDADPEHLRLAITGNDKTSARLAAHNRKSAPFIGEMLASPHTEVVRTGLRLYSPTESHIDKLHERLSHGHLKDRDVLLNTMSEHHLSDQKMPAIAGHPIQPHHTAAIVSGLLNGKMKNPNLPVESHLYQVLHYYPGKNTAPLAKAMEFKHEPWFDEEVGINIARHPLATPDMLKHLSGSSMHNVRHAVAKHANTPIHVLQDLQNDSKELIRSSANQNLRLQGLDYK